MGRKALRLLMGIFLLSVSGMTQVTTGTISGIARDSSAAVIPGVNIAVKNVDTSLTRAVVTDAQGRYQAPSLPLGNYEVQAEKPGFQTGIRRGIELTVGRQAVVNFDLQVGEVTQTVEVTGEAPLIETTSSSVGNLVERSQIENLPLNGRSFEELALLQPAVHLSRAVSGGFNTGFTAQISIRGARPNQNSFLLDGLDVTGPTNSIPGSVGGQSLGVDTVSQFKVETGNFSAQYGRAAGGVVSAVTKSGTNELHGSAFEFHRNDNLDANRWENNRLGAEKPEFKRNQFGLSLGGPIRRDKLFFFAGYEALRDRLGRVLDGVVPTASAREGKIATVNNATGEITGIQQVTKHPAIDRYLDLYPPPNAPVYLAVSGIVDPNLGRYVRNHSEPNDAHYLSGRLDYNLSERDFLFGRYTFDDADNVSSNFSGVLDSITGNRNQYFSLENTHVFSPTVLNSVRVGVNRSYTANKPEVHLSDDVLNDLAWIDGRPLFKSQSSIAPAGGISSISTGNSPRIFAWNVLSAGDDLTINRGSHSIKGGLMFQRMQFNVLETQNQAGAVRFRGLSDFLRGRPRDISTLFLGVSLGTYHRFNYLGWYVQDDIRWTPTFTLNLGLRHEFYTGPREKYGNACQLYELDRGIRCGGRVFPTSATTKNFGPRVGFAWDVFGDGKTSMRGGVGLYYDSMSPAWWYSAANDPRPPFEAEITNGNLLAAAFPNFTALLAQGVSEDVEQTPTGARITATPSTMQYSFTLQRQLSETTAVALGYVGSQGRHIFMRVQENISTNMIFLDGRRYFPGPPPGVSAREIRVNPDFGRTRISRTEANSSYNGMIASINNRFRGGLQFQVSYTWGKSLDVLSSSTSSQIMIPDDWTADRSLSDHDTRHVFSTNFTWELPFGPGRTVGSQTTGFAGKLLEGWQLGGLGKVNSAFPMHISINEFNWSRNGSTGSGIQERPNLVFGKSNNPVTGDPDRWFDPSSFVPPELGYYGNNGRNTISGPDSVSVDFSLVKHTRLSEQFDLQFRAEFFNVLNRVNFAEPEGLDIFDSAGKLLPNVGRIEETHGTARQIQFGLKLSW